MKWITIYTEHSVVLMNAKNTIDSVGNNEVAMDVRTTGKMILSKKITAEISRMDYHERWFEVWQDIVKARENGINKFSKILYKIGTKKNGKVQNDRVTSQEVIKSHNHPHPERTWHTKEDSIKVLFLISISFVGANG